MYCYHCRGRRTCPLLRGSKRIVITAGEGGLVLFSEVANVLLSLQGKEDLSFVQRLSSLSLFRSTIG